MSGIHLSECVRRESIKRLRSSTICCVARRCLRLRRVAGLGRGYIGGSRLIRGVRLWRRCHRRRIHNRRRGRGRGRLCRSALGSALGSILDRQRLFHPWSGWCGNKNAREMRDQKNGRRSGNASSKNFEELLREARRGGTFASHGTLQQILASRMKERRWGEIEIIGAWTVPSLSTCLHHAMRVLHLLANRTTASTAIKRCERRLC